jgi:hypothetical protein
MPQCPECAHGVVVELGCLHQTLNRPTTHITFRKEGEGTKQKKTSGVNIVAACPSQSVVHSMATALDEVVRARFVPRVWVSGSWFGFALHCVALLCAVYVHLHLVL